MKKPQRGGAMPSKVPGKVQSGNVSKSPNSKGGGVKKGGGKRC